MLTARILTLINTDREGYEGCSTTIAEQMAANDDEEGKAFAQKSYEMRRRFAHEFFFFLKDSCNQ